MNIQEILKQHKKSVTPERVKLYNWMKSKHLFNSQDLERDFAWVWRASIFRTIKLFVELWVLRSINLWESGESYEIECCSAHHHEHMKCESCNEVLSFESNEICNKIFEHAEKLWFTISQHSLSILWKCKSCNY